MNTSDWICNICNSLNNFYGNKFSYDTTTENLLSYFLWIMGILSLIIFSFSLPLQFPEISVEPDFSPLLLMAWNSVSAFLCALFFLELLFLYTYTVLDISFSDLLQLICSFLSHSKYFLQWNGKYISQRN